MRRPGLTFRLVTAVTLLLLLTAGLVSGILYERLSGLLERAEYRALTGGANAHAKLVEERMIEGLRRNLLTLADDPSLQELLHDHRSGVVAASRAEHVARVFAATLAQRPAYLRIRLLVPDTAYGRELLRVARVPGNAQSARTPDNDLEARVDESYYRIGSALARGGVYLSEVRLMRRDGRVLEPRMPLIQASTPIQDDARRLLGVLAI
jgi:hypothetical protein